MTLVYASPNHDDGHPKTHAFVIGVGKYPYLEGGDQGPPNPKVPGLGQLTSPPVSARKFTDWLIESLNNPDAPLGTIELLLSPNELYTLPNGQQQQVQAATIDNIFEAYEAYLRRCNSNISNVAIFYFCGHGLEKEDLVLLPEDFARSQTNPWRNSINFHKTYRGMSTCRAQTQCYFIDACRQVAMETLETSDFGGQSLVSNDLLNQRPRTALTLFATSAGTAAFGDQDQVSRFTDALIEALNGGGADKQSGGRWVVDTDHLGGAVKQIIDQRNLSLRRDQHQNVEPKPAGECRIIHRLCGPPNVLATVRCKLRAATAEAEFYLKGRSQQYWRRPPAPGDWSQAVEAGTYDVGAIFAQGDFQTQELSEEWVRPPYYVAELEIV